MVKQKQKKDSPKIKKIHTPPPILSRGSRMRAINIEVSGIWGLLALLKTKKKMEMTYEELKDDISRYHKPNSNEPGGRNCDLVMGESCTAGGKYNPNIPFEQQSPYGRWRMAGGFCPEGQTYDDAYTLNPTRCTYPSGQDNGDFIVYHRSDCSYPNVRIYGRGGKDPGSICGRWVDSSTIYCSYYDHSTKPSTLVGNLTHADMVWYGVKWGDEYDSKLSILNKVNNWPSRPSHNWSSVDIQNMVIKSCG